MFTDLVVDLSLRDIRLGADALCLKSGDDLVDVKFIAPSEVMAATTT